MRPSSDLGWLETLAQGRSADLLYVARAEEGAVRLVIGPVISCACWRRTPPSRAASPVLRTAQTMSLRSAASAAEEAKAWGVTAFMTILFGFSGHICRGQASRCGGSGASLGGAIRLLGARRSSRAIASAGAAGLVGARMHIRTPNVIGSAMSRRRRVRRTQRRSIFVRVSVRALARSALVEPAGRSGHLDTAGMTGQPCTPGGRPHPAPQTSAFAAIMITICSTNVSGRSAPLLTPPSVRPRGFLSTSRAAGRRDAWVRAGECRRGCLRGMLPGCDPRALRSR